MRAHTQPTSAERILSHMPQHAWGDRYPANTIIIWNQVNDRFFLWLYDFSWGWTSPSTDCKGPVSLITARTAVGGCISIGATFLLFKGLCQAVCYLIKKIHCASVIIFQFSLVYILGYIERLLMFLVVSWNKWQGCTCTYWNMKKLGQISCYLIAMLAIITKNLIIWLMPPDKCL